jgi:hypothetical protein
MWNNLIQQLISILKKMTVDNNLPTEAGKKLYETTLTFLGKDPTPEDKVPDEVACMEVVNFIHNAAFGEPIGGGASTYLGWIVLKNHKKFAEMKTPLTGDICIAPTGLNDAVGRANGITNGHIGIVCDNGTIASNDSKTGLFIKNYTLWSWRYRFSTIGHFPIFFYRRIII